MAFCWFCHEAAHFSSAEWLCTYVWRMSNCMMSRPFSHELAHIPNFRPKSDLTYFGRTVCCNNENELMSWLAGMLIAQVWHLSGSMIKLTEWSVRPVKTQISLGIRPVWPVFTVGIKKPRVLSNPLSVQWRLWSDWVDAQADLNLCSAHIPFCWFCHVVAHFKVYG